jgi:multiple sugar transport system substrate-binding protein
VAPTDDTGTSLWTPPGGRLSRRSFLTNTARLGLGALVAGSTGSLLSACGSQGSSGTENTIDFWQWYAPQEGGSYSVKTQNDWFNKLVNDWNARGGKKIKLTYIPIAQYIEGTQLQSAFVAREGPDIFVISPGDFLRYYNGGVLYDLTDAIGTAGIDDFYKSAMGTRMVDGRVYALPMEAEPLTMFYSVEAFEKAGLSEGDIPKTWDQLLSVAEKLRSGKQFGLLFETKPNVYQNFTWYPFLWQAGGDVVDPSGKQSTFDSPATVKALAFWQDAIKSGVAPRTTQGGGGGDLVANLASGYAAMAEMVTAGGSFLEAGAPKFKYGMFPLPVPDASAKPITDMGGWAFCVNKFSRNAEVAAEFSTWAVASAESVDRMVDWAFNAKKSLPVRKSVMKKAAADGLFDKDKLMAYSAFDVVGLDPKALDTDTMPYGRGEPRLTPEVVKGVGDAIQAAQLNGVDPSAAAAGGHEQINTILKSYQGAPLGSVLT